MISMAQTEPLILSFSFLLKNKQTLLLISLQAPIAQLCQGGGGVQATQTPPCFSSV